MFSHLRLFLLSLASLFTVAFVEKTIFAIYHDQLRSGFSAGEILYALIWGIRFDLAVAAALGLLVYLFSYALFRILRLPLRMLLRHLTFAAGVVVILVSGGDLIYFDEAGRHLGYELLEMHNSAGALTAAAMGSYTLPVMLQLLMIPPLFFAVRFAFARDTTPLSVGGWRRFTPELQLVVVIILGALMIRGGVQRVPQEPLHAQQMGNTRLAAIALNGSYNAIFSSVTPYSAAAVLNEEPGPGDLVAVRSLYSQQKSIPREKRAYNVVLIFLESWSASFMDSYGGEWETTPFFDELRGNSLTSLRTLAGGKRTTEGMFATLCSAQNPLGQTIGQTQLQNYDYDCLPELLGEAGYSSAFFQGTLANTSGTGPFAQMLGFRESYGKSDIKQLRYQPNSWGVHDHDLYDFALARMKELPQPFLVGINTNTTHDNQIPPGIEPAFPGEGREEKYLSTLRLADDALGEFMATVQADPELAENTLFVLVGDHTGIVRGSVMDGYSVPFLIHGPDVEPRVVDAVTSQRDIGPTLMGLLGMELPSWFTGQSLLGPEAGIRFADFYHTGILGWVEDDLLMTLRVKEPQQYSCFHYRDDPLLQSPQSCGDSAEQMVQRAMGFTRLSQWLMYSGQSTRFAAALEAVQQTGRTEDVIVGTLNRTGTGPAVENQWGQIKPE